MLALVDVFVNMFVKVIVFMLAFLNAYVNRFVNVVVFMLVFVNVFVNVSMLVFVTVLANIGDCVHARVPKPWLRTFVAVLMCTPLPLAFCYHQTHAKCT